MIFIKFKNGKRFIFSVKTKFFLTLINISIISFIRGGQYNYIGHKDIRIALCTMEKEENLYLNEFVEYYIKLGVDHIFIYDDNEPYIEKITNYIDKKYQNNITIYETKKFNIYGQSSAFNHCYRNNLMKFDWFIMVDLDEFLYIVDNTLKQYLNQKIFDKCDFIKFHWVYPKNSDLIYYDSRSLFERFKPPYEKSEFIKSVIRGNISDLKYWVHSPSISPKRNITCNNVGKKIYYREMNFESFSPINIDKAYIIHFDFKSTEEFINKIKRGYKSWFGKEIENVIIRKILLYLKINGSSPEKINLIESELGLNLSKYLKKSS